MAAPWLQCPLSRLAAGPTYELQYCFCCLLRIIAKGGKIGDSGSTRGRRLPMGCTHAG